MAIKILLIATLAAFFILAVNRIAWLISNRIREWFYRRDMKRDEQRRERCSLDERFDALSKYNRSLQQDIWKLEETVNILAKELDNKENKKNVKKKKRN